MSDVLDEILDYKRSEVEGAKDACPEGVMRRLAASAPPARPFAEAIAVAPGALANSP